MLQAAHGSGQPSVITQQAADVSPGSLKNLCRSARPLAPYTTKYPAPVVPRTPGAGQPLPDVATGGLPGSLALAAHIGGEPGDALAAAAREAFVHAMNVAVTVSVGVALVGALVALVWLPSMPRQEPPVRGVRHDRELAAAGGVSAGTAGA